MSDQDVQNGIGEQAVQPAQQASAPQVQVPQIQIPTPQIHMPPQRLQPAYQPAKPQIRFGNRGLQLQTFEDVWRFAQCLLRSGLAPKHFTTAESLMIAIQMGAECGLSPMASVQNICVINGKPRLWGDGMLAVCRASGLFDESVFEEKIVGEGDDRVAYCTTRRLPNGKITTRSFSWRDAVTAGYHKKEGPWQTNPNRMLQMRARGFNLRDVFPDVVLGLPLAEEAFGEEEIRYEDLQQPQTPDQLAEMLA